MSRHSHSHTNSATFRGYLLHLPMTFGRDALVCLILRLAGEWIACICQVLDVKISNVCNVCQLTNPLICKEPDDDVQNNASFGMDQEAPKTCSAASASFSMTYLLAPDDSATLTVGTVYMSTGTELAATPSTDLCPSADCVVLRWTTPRVLKQLAKGQPTDPLSYVVIHHEKGP